MAARKSREQDVLQKEMRKAGLGEKQRLTRKQLLEIQSKTNDSAPGPVRTRKATVMAKNKVVDNPKPPKKPARPRGPGKKAVEQAAKLDAANLRDLVRDEARERAAAMAQVKSTVEPLTSTGEDMEIVVDARDDVPTDQDVQMDDADVPSDGESDATPPPYPDHGEYPSEEELEDGSVLNQGAFVGPGATSGGESEVTPPTTPENDEDLSDEEAEEGSAVSQDGHTTPSGAIDFPDLQQQGDSPHSEPIPRSPLNALSDPDSGSDSDSAEGDQSADERGYRTDVSMNDEECWPEWYGVGSEAQNEECWPEWYGVGGEAQNEEETLDGTGHMSVDPSSDEDETQRRGPVQASRTKAKTGLAPRGHVGRNVLRKQANKRQRESSRERSTTSDNEGVIRSPERKKRRTKEITTEEESEVKLVDKERMLFLAKKLSNFDPLTVKEKKQLAKAITVYTSRKESGVPKIDAALLQADVLRDRYAKMTFKVPIEGGFKSTPGGIVEIHNEKSEDKSEASSSSARHGRFNAIVQKGHFLWKQEGGNVWVITFALPERGLGEMREWSSKSVARDAPGLMGKLRDIIFEELQPHRTQVLAERLKKMKKDEEELRCANNSNKLFQKREKAIREILGDEEWAKIEAQLKEEKKKKRKGKKVPGK